MDILDFCDMDFTDPSDSFDFGDSSDSSDRFGIPDYEYNPSFGSNPPDKDIDGYIPEGKVTLESVNGNTKTFDSYSKNGSDYVFEDGQWKKISGSGTVTIDNVKYQKT